MFRYVTRDKIGKIHRGQCEADNEKMLELKLQEGGFQLIEISLKPSKKAPNSPKHNSSGNEDALPESSMETHGQPQAKNNGVKAEQILTAVAVALIGIALWMFAR